MEGGGGERERKREKLYLGYFLGYYVGALFILEKGFIKKKEKEKHYYQLQKLVS